MSPAPCPDLEILSPYTDGELSPAESSSVRRHVTSCDHCRRRLAEIREIDGMLFQIAHRHRRPRLLPLGLATAAGLLLAIWLALPSRTETGPAPIVLPEATEAGPTACERVEALVLAEIEGRRDPERHLQTLGFAARRHLRTRLGDEDPRVVRAALRLTVEIRDRSSAPEVATLLGRDDLADEAAMALGDLGVESTAPALASAFRNGTIPEASLDALVRLEAADTLGDLLDDEDDEERRELLLSSCGRLPVRLAAPLLARHLDSPLAREILAAFREEAVPVLRRRLSSGDMDAARALGILSDEASLRRFVELLDDPIRRAAGARALALLDSDQAFEALFTAAGDGMEDPVVLALAGDRRLEDRFRDGRHRERRRAVRLLGLCGDQSSLPTLEDALTDRALADEAVRALGRIGGRHADAVAVLARAGGEPALRILVIQALGETGRPEAVPALRDLAIDRATTRATVAALGGIPDDEAIRALLTLMERPRYESAARRALGRLPADRVASLRSNRERDDPPARSRSWPEI